jgi:inorganic triphosphatase YgiF
VSPVGGTRDQIEREVKLDVDDGFEVPVLDGVEPLESRRLDAVYHDTPDLRLLDRGITVRRRTGEGTRWTVKFPSDEVAAAGGVARREVDVDSDAEVPPTTVVGLVEPFLGGGSLAPLARLVSVRERSALVGPDGSTVAEIDDDRVRARAMADGAGGPGAEVTFREIEVEFEANAPSALIDGVVARFRAAGARPTGGQPKVERALTMLGLR